MTTVGMSLPGLNPAQREAVVHTHGPLLVLAGAGSGKTRVLTARIAHLLESHGVAPDRIFAVTFTNRAAGEMKARVATLLGRDPAGLWIGTFHSLSARLLRREAHRLGFAPGFTIYDEDDRLRLIKRVMETRNHSTKLFPPKLVQHVVSSAKNRMQTPEALLASAPNDPLIAVAADMLGALGRALLAANAMDFDDLLLHPLTLFQQHPDRLEVWQRRFQHVLVDEFQDTNMAQYHLVRSLGVHGNVCVVGDDDQSIYGWRGADVGNMRAFQRDFPGAGLIRLEENYRSTRVILDSANAAIAPNQGRIGKTLRTVRPGGEPVIVLSAADERDEAEWLAAELHRRIRSGDRDPRDMAVLYRTNAQSRALEEAFRRAGIPYRIIGAISFYDRREVKDLIAYLRLVVNPADDQAFLRGVGVPKRGIGEASLGLLQERAAAWGMPLLEAASRADRIEGLRPNVRAAFQRFAGLPRGLAERHPDASPAVVIEDLVRSLDYEAVLRREDQEGEERGDNVRELLAAAAAWSEVIPEDADSAETGSPPLQRFLAEAALLSGDDRRAGPEEGVTLMTLHTAKGLEWPVVAIAGLEDGLFPLGRALDTVDGLEEERRLFYVGLTRAKDTVILTWARARRRGGELKPGTASRFLDDLPSPLVEERQTSSLWRPTLGGHRGWRGTAAAPSWSGGTRSGPTPARAAPAAEAWPEEEVSQVTPRYVKGERVSHRRFGSGVIRGLTGAGKALAVSVVFDDSAIGTKTLLVAYAGLERDGDPA